jgi:hypothetical protein
MDIRMNRKRPLFALVGVAALIATAGIAWQILGIGAQYLHDAGSLPSHLSACGRTWTRASTIDGQTMAKDNQGHGGILIDPGLYTACPAGLCTSASHTDRCDTVAYVRVADDAYVSYELSGGP